MKVIKTKLKFTDLGTAPFVVETAPEHIKLHTITLAVGKRGSGKSYFISNLLNWLKFDRILIISPTFESNYSQFKKLGVEAHDIFDPDDLDVVAKIQAVVDGERDDVLEYRQKLQMLKELKAIYKSPTNLDDSYHLFSEYVDEEGKWQNPVHKWGGKKPRLAVFVDDAQSTAIFRNRKFLNMVTRHRHLGSFPGDEASIGISMFIGVQSYTATGGGLPKVIRGNATHMALWKTKNDKELQLIAEEMAGEVSIQKFKEMYQYAIENGGEFPFLFIDLHKKKEHPSQFRVNYLDFIVDTN
jgi:hypothetical protein